MDEHPGRGRMPAWPCRLFGVRRLDGPGLAPVRHPARPGRAGRRQVPGPAGAGTVHPEDPGRLPAADRNVVTSPSQAAISVGRRGDAFAPDAPLIDVWINDN